MNYQQFLSRIAPLLAIKATNPYSSLGGGGSQFSKSPKGAPTTVKPGWTRFNGFAWDSIDTDRLPPALVLDIETDQSVTKGQWTARVAVAYGSDGHWYQWLGRSALIPWPPGRIVVAHNGGSHDANYLSCLYDDSIGLPPTYFIDTRVLAAIAVGCPDEVRPLWKKLQSQAQRPGANGHPWIATISDLSLRALASSQLGIVMEKKFHKVHTSAPKEVLFNHYQPQEWAAVCAQDVARTVDILQKFWPTTIAAYGENEELLWGLVKLMSATWIASRCALTVRLTNLKDEWMEKYKDALNDAIDLELAKPKEKRRTDLNWSLVTRGENKGEHRWMADALKKPGSFGFEELSVLIWTFDGEVVDLESPKVKGHNRNRRWVTRTQPLGVSLFSTDRYPLLDAMEIAFRPIAQRLITAAAALKHIAHLESKLADLHYVGDQVRIPIEFGDPAKLLAMPFDSLTLCRQDYEHAPTIGVLDEPATKRKPPKCFQASSLFLDLTRQKNEWEANAAGFDRLLLAAGRSEFAVRSFSGESILCGGLQ